MSLTDDLVRRQAQRDAGPQRIIDWYEERVAKLRAENKRLKARIKRLKEGA